MWFAVKRLSLGVLLVVSASAPLLISDWRQRRSDAHRLPNVAVLQLTATAAQEDSARGIDDAFRHSGFVEGENIRIRHFNALGDLATANAIAKQVTTGDYDIVVTVTTPLLQAVANNNHGKRKHAEVQRCY